MESSIVNSGESLGNPWRGHRNSEFPNQTFFHFYTKGPETILYLEHLCILRLFMGALRLD
jgi:hypothetical protein